MSLIEFTAHLAIGRLWVWLLQTSGLTRPLWTLHPKLTELSECDLCLGFWVYLILGAFLPAPITLWPYAVELVLFAGFSAFVAHLLTLGWVTKFGTVVI